MHPSGTPELHFFFFGGGGGGGGFPYVVRVLEVSLLLLVGFGRGASFHWDGVGQDLGF